ncbi:hypothetical protein J1605_017858 [Eschrichtius robustus]|uniref:Uncharacterized protein n=1 Tax=Eschrichtius robustus TaxID=9764 RepID=A0AB34I0X5_ESCRO|nr:hypothetical protein J1605_017858 [Eschrichtius robustus]
MFSQLDRLSSFLRALDWTPSAQVEGSPAGGGQVSISTRRDNCGQVQGFQLVALPSLILYLTYSRGQYAKARNRAGAERIQLRFCGPLPHRLWKLAEKGTSGPDPTTVYVDMRALRHDRYCDFVFSVPAVQGSF